MPIAHTKITKTIIKMKTEYKHKLILNIKLYHISYMYKTLTDGLEVDYCDVFI